MTKDNADATGGHTADGGQAYPAAYTVGPNDDLYPPTPGMTLRDHFASQALAGLCANSGGPYQASSQSGWAIVNCTVETVAREAYALADAMLAERSK